MGFFVAGVVFGSFAVVDEGMQTSFCRFNLKHGGQKGPSAPLKNQKNCGSSGFQCYEDRREAKASLYRLLFAAPSC